VAGDRRLGRLAPLTRKKKSDKEAIGGKSLHVWTKRAHPKKQEKAQFDQWGKSGRGDHLSDLGKGKAGDLSPISSILGYFFKRKGARHPRLKGGGTNFCPLERKSRSTTPTGLFTTKGSTGRFGESLDSERLTRVSSQEIAQYQKIEKEKPIFRQAGSQLGGKSAPLLDRKKQKLSTCTGAVGENLPSPKGGGGRGVKAVSPLGKESPI